MHTGYAESFRDFSSVLYFGPYPESDDTHKKYTKRVIVNDRCPDKIPGTFRIDALNAMLGNARFR